MEFFNACFTFFIYSCLCHDNKIATIYDIRLREKFTSNYYKLSVCIIFNLVMAYFLLLGVINLPNEGVSFNYLLKMI